MDLLEVFAERGVAPKPEQTVVDIGCGSGIVGFSLIRHIADAYCISIDRPEVLDVARNQAAQIGVENRVTFRPGDSGNLGLEPDSVNVALLINVAQYLDDDELHACVAGVRSACGRRSQARLTRVPKTRGPRCPRCAPQARPINALRMSTSRCLPQPGSMT